MTHFSYSNVVLIKSHKFLTQVTGITDRSRTGCVVYADLKYSQMNENEDNSWVDCRHRLAEMTSETLVYRLSLYLRGASSFVDISPWSCPFTN